MTPGGAAPVVKDLVLVGGGHAHVTVLRRFGMRPLPGVRLTLIARDLDAPYSGMLPGLIAGQYRFDETHIDLGPLARFAGARLFHDSAVGLDLAARRVICRDRPPVPFDLLSLDIGSAPNTREVPGAAEHAIPVKPIDRFVAQWERLCGRALARSGPTRLGVVGGGAGGVELLLAARHRLGQLLAGRPGGAATLDCHLVTQTPAILPGFNAGARARLERALRAAGVSLHTGTSVARVEPGRLIAADGASIALDEILWVTAASAAPWLRDTGLALDERGFVLVDDALQSVSHPHVFAAGDIAAVRDHPRPKAGVFAVRQGPPLADNLRRRLLGRAARPFRPQRRFLTLVNTADGRAVAARGGWSAEGALIWRWKDWIDRRFMARFNDLPEMPAAAAPALPAGLADADALATLASAAMRCGGCGAKVGSSVLARVLARLDTAARDDVLIGLAEADDAAVTRVPPGKLLVQSVDHFRAFVDDPWWLGRIAANHALGDLWAMGAEPRSALAIATVPHGLEDRVEDTLFQMLSGALGVLRDAGADLVGGHSGEGAELALGFAVTGLADPDRLLRKSGLRPGDRLILTKPLGSGTLLAAHMRGKARGRWIDAALAGMAQSSRDAARILADHGATACTDVTGFGLLGHLVEMARASRVGATVALAALPVLDGAAETLARGIVSSLQPENLRLRRAVADVDGAARHPLYPLVFDPQTAGGLLAGIPAARAEACVAALRAAGYAAAAAIGRVDAPENPDAPIRLAG